MTTNVKKLVRMGVLAALSIVLLLIIRFPIIPSANFLEYEPADVPIIIGGFMYGPLAGLLIAAVVAIIQAITVSAAGGWVGLVMHFIATGTLVLVASTVYKFNKSIKGAIIGVILGSLCMTLIMIPSNLFFSVKFYGYPYEAVKAMLPTAIIPFNLIKSGINSIITILVYKSISKLFKFENKELKA